MAQLVVVPTETIGVVVELVGTVTDIEDELVVEDELVGVETVVDGDEGVTEEVVGFEVVGGVVFGLIETGVVFGVVGTGVVFALVEGLVFSAGADTTGGFEEQTFKN